MKGNVIWMYYTENYMQTLERIIFYLSENGREV